jgi:rod shape-determining protein MreC
MVINRGSQDGVKTDQFVLGVNNIIGRVTSVTEKTAKIQLITDKNSRIPVRISDKDTILEGSGNNIAEINMLSAEHKIETGTPVYVRSQPGYLNTPMVAGRVSDFTKNSRHPLLWDITVEPACMVENLSNVVVIVMNRQVGQPE